MRVRAGARTTDLGNDRWSVFFHLVAVIFLILVFEFLFVVFSSRHVIVFHIGNLLVFHIRCLLSHLSSWKVGAQGSKASTTTAHADCRLPIWSSAAIACYSPGSFDFVWF
jgi:hypothetical protein